MNKFNKSIQQVIQFALTFFMAMFALISGLQLVYLVKNGVTTQGLIMVVFFAAAAFAFNRVKENQKKQVAALSAAQNAATERQKSAPVYKHPASVQQFIASSKACPRCRDKLAVCLEPQHGSTFPHLATGAEPGDCKYYCPTCKKFLSMDEEYEDFTWEAPEVPEGDGRRYHFSQEYLKPLERQKTISTIAMTIGVPGIFLFLYLLKVYASNLALAGVILCAVVSSVSVTISSKARRALRESQKVYYEFSEDGLIQSDGQKPVFYPWKDIRILYQVGDDFQGVAFGTTGRNFIITDYIERKTKIVERIVAHVKDHAQIDSRIFEHIDLPDEEDATSAN